MKSKTQGIILGLIILFLISGWIAPKTQAHSSLFPDQHEGDCRVCHGQENFYAVFENGEFLSLTISKEHTLESVHWKAGLYCEDCHLDQSLNLHPDPEINSCESCHDENFESSNVILSDLSIQLPFMDQREISISLNQTCINCHKEEAEKSADSTHQMVFDQGNRSAPICIDCHGSHQVSNSNEFQSKISPICGNCHISEYSTFEGSVHGAGLSEEINSDLPTCVDCHGVHNIYGPYDITFRNTTISICTTCHVDEELMAPYGISTLVLETYLSDFHGRSANLFILSNNNRPTDKAVCYDCHGIHNILSPDNPASQVYPDNLLGTCQKCHLDAAITFPKAWLGHYVPTIEDNPYLYIINLIYPILIGLVIGTALIYILLDARKRHYMRKAIDAAKNFNKESGDK